MSVFLISHIVRLRTWLSSLSFATKIQVELALLLSLIVSGGVGFHYLEGWRWLDSFYFTVITMASVGYGDFAPATDAGKILSMCFSIIALPIFAYVGATVIEHRLNRGKNARRIQMEMQEMLDQTLSEIKDMHRHQSFEVTQLERIEAIEKELLAKMSELKK